MIYRIEFYINGDFNSLVFESEEADLHKTIPVDSNLHSIVREILKLFPDTKVVSLEIKSISLIDERFIKTVDELLGHNPAFIARFLNGDIYLGPFFVEKKLFGMIWYSATLFIFFGLSGVLENTFLFPITALLLLSPITLDLALSKTINYIFSDLRENGIRVENTGKSFARLSASWKSEMKRNFKNKEKAYIEITRMKF